LRKPVSKDALLEAIAAALGNPLNYQCKDL
jgi:hypothetical protein